MLLEYIATQEKMKQQPDSFQKHMQIYLEYM